MNETPVLILAKAQVLNLEVNLARSGLCMGDTAALMLDSDGRASVTARARRLVYGFFPKIRETRLGYLEPKAAQMMMPHLIEGRDLRVRIVGLTPEHLCGAAGPELFISVWGAKPVREFPFQPGT